MLLSSDTYRKAIASITGVSLPFATYLLTLLRTNIKTNRAKLNIILAAILYARKI
jgi:hypothetical protein